MLHLQTPKRTLQPPLPSSTSSTMSNTRGTTKYTLPPLSSILSSSTAQSNYFKDHPLIFNSSKPTTASTPYKQQMLPSIDSIATTPIDSSTSYDYYSNAPLSSSSIQSTQSHTPTSIVSSKHDYSLDEADTSIIELRKSRNHNETELKTTTVLTNNHSSTALDKAYAFISHSPATFPSQEPSIDNASLARRKRRRTSTQELNILNKEFKEGTTPNKMRRIAIAKKVSMTEKAVQIWFQNKRQSLRKHSNQEKEITLLPETPALPLYPKKSQDQPYLISSTPIKPIMNKSLSFVDSPQTVLEPLPLPRSYSIPVLKTMPVTNTSRNSPQLEPTTMIQTNKKQPQSLNCETTSTMTFKLIPSKITQKLQQESNRESSFRKPLGDVTNKVTKPSVKKL